MYPVRTARRIFEDGRAITPARPSGGNSASGVDPASVREAELARHQGRAKCRESRSEAADGRVAGGRGTPDGCDDCSGTVLYHWNVIL